jgi:hypothetical protein
MNDDYDYRATFDFSQNDLKAIERAVAILEEKFSILGDYDESDLPDGVPFYPRDEVFISKATDLLRLERDIFEHDDWVDIDEIRGHMLSAAQLRPSVRLRALIEQEGSNRGSVCEAPTPASWASSPWSASALTSRSCPRCTKWAPGGAPT